MLATLKTAFSLIPLTILGITIWSSLQMPSRETPQLVVGHPWFIATPADAHLGFIIFWLWVSYNQTSNLVRALWPP